MNWLVEILLICTNIYSKFSRGLSIWHVSLYLIYFNKGKSTESFSPCCFTQRNMELVWGYLLSRDGYFQAVVGFPSWLQGHRALLCSSFVFLFHQHLHWAMSLNDTWLDRGGERTLWSNIRRLTLELKRLLPYAITYKTRHGLKPNGWILRFHFYLVRLHITFPCCELENPKVF